MEIIRKKTIFEYKREYVLFLRTIRPSRARLFWMHQIYLNKDFKEEELANFLVKPRTVSETQATVLGYHGHYRKHGLKLKESGPIFETTSYQPVLRPDGRLQSLTHTFQLKVRKSECFAVKIIPKAGRVDILLYYGGTIVT